MILARHDQERFAVKVLIRSFESFCHTAHICTSGHFGGTRAARGSPELSKMTMSPTRQRPRPFKVRAICDCLIVFIQPASFASGAGGVRVEGRPSSLEAAFSQTSASCNKEARTSFECAWRAHLKHSSAIARYSAAVFIGRCTPAELLADFRKLVCLRPDSTKEL
jgi:hypothetical protein